MAEALFMEMYDLTGIEAFIHDQYEELRFVKLDVDSLEEWIDNADEAIDEAFDKLRLVLEDGFLLS